MSGGPPRRRQRLGTHVLVDGWEAPFPVLDDPVRVRRALEATARAARLTLLHLEVEHFAPQGVTAMGLLAESHLAIHTWPEHGAFAADLFHCGELTAEEVPILVRELATSLEAAYWRHEVVERIAPRANEAGRTYGVTTESPHTAR